MDDRLPERVLVTGADGKIGRAVVAELAARGVDVVALSIEWTAPSAASRVVTGDATVESDVAEALDGVTAVVHLAAIAHPSLADPYTVYRTNTDATFNVLAQAGQRNIRRAVIASSINAFGVPMNHHDIAPAYYPIDEEIPIALDDWYSLSKRSDELTAEMAASRWGMDIVAIRYPFVGLPHEVHGQSRLEHEQLPREGWSYLDLRDAVDVVLKALVAPVRGAVVIGVSAAETYRPEPTAQLLDTYAPSVPRRRKLRGREALIDTTRAKELLGFEPRHSAADHPDDRPAASTVGGAR